MTTCLKLDFFNESAFFNGGRFDGKDFLTRWSGKKIMFVGDSLSLNMWESMACMIHESVPNAKTSFLRKESLSTVIFQVGYFCFYFPFLIFCHVYHTSVIVQCAFKASWLGFLSFFFSHLFFLSLLVLF